MSRRKNSDDDDDMGMDATNDGIGLEGTVTSDSTHGVKFNNEESSLSSSFGHLEDVASYLEQEALGLSIHHVERLKKSHPSIFQLSVQFKIKPTVDFLLSICGCSIVVDGDEGGDMNDEQQSPQQPFTTKTRNSESEQQNRRAIVGKIILANPNILNLSLHSNLLPKVEFLRNLGFQLSSSSSSSASSSSYYEEMMPLWKKCPGILGLSTEDNLKPKSIFLKRLLRTTREDVWCQRNKLPFSIPSDDHDDPITEVVNDKATKLLKKCLLSHPQLLLLSMENLHSKVDYFNTIPLPPRPPTSSISSSSSSATTTNKPKTKHLNDDKSPPSLAARIAISAPSVYSLSLADNILPTVECLSKAWCGGGNGNGEGGTSTSSLPFGVPLAEYPTVLTLSLEGNIIPTLQFYNRTGYITLDGEGRIRAGSSSSTGFLFARTVYCCVVVQSSATPLELL